MSPIGIIFIIVKGNDDLDGMGKEEKDALSLGWSMPTEDVYTQFRTFEGGTKIV